MADPRRSRCSRSKRNPPIHSQVYFPRYRISANASDEHRRKFATLAILLLVFFTPLVIIGTVLAFRIVTGDLLRDEVSSFDFLELSVIAFILVAVFTFGQFQLTQYIAREHLPQSETEYDESEDGT